eukprot:2274182-Rhodomonas_salina.3
MIYTPSPLPGAPVTVPSQLCSEFRPPFKDNGHQTTACKSDVERTAACYIYNTKLHTQQYPAGILWQAQYNYPIITSMTGVPGFAVELHHISIGKFCGSPLKIDFLMHLPEHEGQAMEPGQLCNWNEADEGLKVHSTALPRHRQLSPCEDQLQH